MRIFISCCLVAAMSFATTSAIAAGADESDYFGLLRARDLTPFGFLRLDMRPTHARVAPEGGWVPTRRLGGRPYNEAAEREHRGTG